MKKIVLATALLSATLLTATTEKEIKSEAKSALVKLKNRLQIQLKQNMKKGGPSQAAAFCSNRAEDITKEVNKSFANQTEVRRVSLKNRNIENAPRSDEKIVLEQMQQDLLDGKKLPNMIVKKIYDKSYKVYKPIFINKGVCLKCHGDSAHRDVNAYAIIKKNYPHDKATEYKMNDLRGAFVVEITTE